MKMMSLLDDGSMPNKRRCTHRMINHCIAWSAASFSQTKDAAAGRGRRWIYVSPFRILLATGTESTSSTKRLRHTDESVGAGPTSVLIFKPKAKEQQDHKKHEMIRKGEKRKAAGNTRRSAAQTGQKEGECSIKTSNLA